MLALMTRRLQARKLVHQPQQLQTTLLANMKMRFSREQVLGWRSQL